jgi:hypothetical protein
VNAARGGSGRNGVAGAANPSTELAALRRRAYGPDADIADDPAAQRRLAELEQLVHVDDAEDTEPDDSAASAPTRHAAAPPAASAGSQASASPSDPRSRNRHRATRIVLFAAAVVGVLAVGLVLGVALGGLLGIGAGIGMGIGSGSGVGLTESEATEPAEAPSTAAPIGAPSDFTLSIAARAGERGAGWASSLEVWGVMAGTMMPHESFGDLDLWTATGVSGSRCLVFSLDGRVITAECAGGNLDPVFDITLGDRTRFIDFPSSLPDGTVIRFVARTDAVDVWIREPAGQ